jgi:hypothetical protein
VSAGRWRGLDAVRVAAGEAELVVLPSRGAKIASLAADGFEWLLQPGAAVPPAPEPGAGFVAAGLWGWDEMLPTIDACEVVVGGDVVRLPDHGEVWSVPWATGGALACAGRALPYRIERSIEATGPRSFAFSYEVTASREVPVLWAAHPQFRAPPGCRIVLPRAVTSVVDVKAPGEPVERAWSDDPLGALPERGSGKLYVPPDVPVAWAGLVQADGRWLRLSWDARVAPYLGIWLDRCALAPEPVIALEPASGFYDDLGRAERAGRVSWVRPEAPLRWRLEVEVGGHAPPPEVC